MRRPPPDNPTLKALQEQRDDLTVKISLLTDSDRPDAERLERLRRTLFDLEKQIGHLNVKAAP